MVTAFSSRSQREVPRRLIKDTAEIGETGVTTKSSVAMYVAAPLTYPAENPGHTKDICT